MQVAQVVERGFAQEGRGGLDQRLVGAQCGLELAGGAQREGLREAALYNLGNLHLRQALKVGAAAPDTAAPLVELAKQSYRDALRADPADWDARYNLERALQLAPEVDEQAADDGEPEPDKEITITTAPAGRSDLP